MFATHWLLIAAFFLYAGVAADQAWRGEWTGSLLYACYAVSNLALYRMLG